MLGSARDYFHDLKRPVGRAVTAAFRRASREAVKDIRAGVRRQFRNSPNRQNGQDVENSIRGYDIPHEGHPVYKFSYSPAAVIRANPSWMEIFEEGGRIFPHGDNLVFPTATGDRLGLDRGSRNIGGRTYVRKWAQVDKAEQMFGPLFEIRDGNATYLAANIGGDPVALFHVRRSVREKKRLSFYDTVERAARIIPREYDKAFDKFTR